MDLNSRPASSYSDSVERNRTKFQGIGEVPILFVFHRLVVVLVHNFVCHHELVSSHLLRLSSVQPLRNVLLPEYAG